MPTAPMQQATSVVTETRYAGTQHQHRPTCSLTLCLCKLPAQASPNPTDTWWLMYTVLHTTATPAQHRTPTVQCTRNDWLAACQRSPDPASGHCLSNPVHTVHTAANICTAVECCASQPVLTGLLSLTAPLPPSRNGQKSLLNKRRKSHCFRAPQQQYTRPRHPAQTCHPIDSSSYYRTHNLQHTTIRPHSSRDCCTVQHLIHTNDQPTTTTNTAHSEITLSFTPHTRPQLKLKHCWCNLLQDCPLAAAQCMPVG